MSNDGEIAVPIGEWFHSHEEDGRDTMVFRRRGFDFPLSRNRIGFQLSRGGLAKTVSIGADDLPVEHAAHWRLDNRHRIIIDGAEFEGLLADAEMILAEPDRIILRRENKDEKPQPA